MTKLKINKLSLSWLQNRSKKGIALYLVLSMIFMTIVLANVVLSIILSQSRLTQHQVGRIQAYYAAQAGMNYALEQLRTGTWTTNIYYLCKSISLCTAAPYSFPRCDIIDFDIPYCTNINIEAPGTSIDGVGRRIQITTDYRYTTP